MASLSPLPRHWTPPDPPGWWARPDGPDFVGRVAELGSLERSWGAALAGRRQAVLLVGDAGAGKSRLAAQACLRFADRGAAVLMGGCLPDAPVAYEPFRGPIAALMVGEGRPEGAGAPLFDLMNALVKPDEPGQPESGHGPDAFETVASALRAACAQRPVVLVLEDLHWATPSTLALLAWVVRRLADSRLLVLMTARQDPPDRSEALHAAMAELAREPGMTRLGVPGLQAEDVRLLVGAQTGIPTERVGVVALRLAGQSAGNPFLLQELCRDLRTGVVQDGGIEGDPHVPDAVRDLFVGRMRRLPEPQQLVLEIAAVIGDQVPWTLLAAVTGSEEEALAAVDGAFAMGIVLPGSAGRTVRFPHALARQAVVGAIPSSRRAALHARVLDVLEVRSGRSLPELEQLAHHALHAADRLDAAKEYLIACAELADRSFAYLEAARHYQRAAGLAGAAAERHRLLLAAVDCLQSSGDYRAARNLSASIVAETGDQRTRLVAATLMENEASLEGGDQQALRTLGRVLTDTPPDLADPAYIAALAGLARALDQVVWSPTAQALSDAALARARAARDDRLIASVLQARLTMALGRPDRARALSADARELSALGRGALGVQTLGTAGFFRCLLGLRLGNPDEVAAGTSDFELAHELSGVWWFGYWPQIAQVSLRFMHGDLEGAEAQAWRLARGVLERHGKESQAHLGLHVFLVRRELGRVDEVRPLVSGDEDPAGLWAPGLLALYTELGMVEPARRLLDALAAPDVLAANARTEYMPTALGFMVEAALLLEDFAVLRRLRPLLAEHAGLLLVSEQFVAVSGTADRYLGMVDSALGAGDPIAEFDAAEDLARRTGFVVDQGLTLAARARHLAATEGSRAPQVLECAAAARALAAPIGQVRVLRMLDALTAGAPHRRVDPHGLTEREAQVLALLGSGASNREIARRLTISEYTAANHVRAIMAKTGSANRTQAALLAARDAGGPTPLRQGRATERAPGAETLTADAEPGDADPGRIRSGEARSLPARGSP